MIRRLPALLLTALLVLVAACGGDDAPAVDDATADSAATGQPDETPADDLVDDATETTAEQPPAPEETVTLSMGVQEGSGSNLPAVVAQQEGIFAAHGLEVEFVPLAGSALLGAITSGDIQFFNQAVQLVGQAIQSNVELRFFCGNYPTNWSTLLVPTSAGLTSTAEGATWQEALQQLEGATLGVAALGATQEHWLVSLLGGAGLDEEALTLVPVGVGPPAIAAFQSGQVDALIGYSFINQQLLAEGETEVLMTFDETGPEYLGEQMNTGWAAPLSWLEENPEVAEQLCTALGEAMEWFQDEANHPRLHEILAGPDFAIDDEAVREEILDPDGILGSFSTEIDCDRLERAANFFVEFGTFQPDPPINCETAVWSG